MSKPSWAHLVTEVSEAEVEQRLQSKDYGDVRFDVACARPLGYWFEDTPDNCVSIKHLGVLLPDRHYFFFREDDATKTLARYEPDCHGSMYQIDSGGWVKLSDVRDLLKKLDK